MDAQELWQEIVALATRLQFHPRPNDDENVVTELLDDGEHLAQLVVSFNELKKEVPRG